MGLQDISRNLSVTNFKPMLDFPEKVRKHLSFQMFFICSVNIWCSCYVTYFGVSIIWYVSDSTNTRYPFYSFVRMTHRTYAVFLLMIKTCYRGFWWHCRSKIQCFSTLRWREWKLGLQFRFIVPHEHRFMMQADHKFKIGYVFKNTITPLPKTIGQALKSLI